MAEESGDWVDSVFGFLGRAADVRERWNETGSRGDTATASPEVHAQGTNQAIQPTGKPADSSPSMMTMFLKYWLYVVLALVAILVIIGVVILLG